MTTQENPINYSLSGNELSESPEFKALLQGNVMAHYNTEEEAALLVGQQLGASLVAAGFNQPEDKFCNVQREDILWALTDIQVRDFALGALGGNPQALPRLLDLVRSAPAGFVAPVACLASVFAYERGEGGLAYRLLDRAQEDNSSYSLAFLLRRVYSAGWPCEAFAQMRSDLHSQVCAGIFGDSPAPVISAGVTA